VFDDDDPEKVQMRSLTYISHHDSLCGNPIGNEGIISLTEALKSPHCELTSLGYVSKTDLYQTFLELELIYIHSLKRNGYDVTILKMLIEAFKCSSLRRVALDFASWFYVFPLEF
jgi:hypothetical protein